MGYHGNILLKTNVGRRCRDRKPNFVEGGGGGGEEVGTESVILWFVVLELLAGGRWWREAKVLFRAGWKHIFFIPGFENVSPGNGSDWVKETHCAVKVERKFIFFWLDDFLYFILIFIIFLLYMC